MLRRRIVARLLVPVFFVVSVMLPRVAYPVLPLAAPLALTVFDAAGSVAIGNVIGAAASALIGGTIFALGMTPGVADAPTIRVPVTTNSGNTNTAMAAPVASATSGFVISYGTGTGGQWGLATSAPDLDSACGIYSTAVGNAQGVTATYVLDGNVCRMYSDGVRHIAWDYAPGVIYDCGSGYTLTSGVCTLTDARQAVSDGKVDYARGGTTLSALPDVDTTSYPLQLATTGAANDTLVMSGQSGSGGPVTVKVQALSSGGSLLTVDTQKTDANGVTYVNHAITQINADGVVTGATSSAESGQLSYNAESGVYDVLTSGAANPAVDPITFPDDYARAGEAGSAAAQVVSKLNDVHADTSAIKDALTSTGALPADPTIPTPDDFNSNWFGDTFNGLKGWSLPAHSSVCPTSSFTWNNTAYTFSAHCALVQDHFNALEAAMFVAWSVLALFIVMRA